MCNTEIWKQITVVQYNHCCNHIQLLSPPPRRESIVTGLRGPSVPPQHPEQHGCPLPPALLPTVVVFGGPCPHPQRCFLASNSLSPASAPWEQHAPRDSGDRGACHCTVRPSAPGWALTEECGQASHQAGDDSFAAPFCDALLAFLLLFLTWLLTGDVKSRRGC